jgi:ankyrin repeat protein
MKKLLLVLLLAAAGTARAETADDDWRMFARVLALVQPIVHAAAASPDPRAAEKEFESILAGRNAKANRLAGEFFDDAFQDMPAQYKASLGAMARDFAVLARRERERAAQRGETVTPERALQARKDLQAMGLTYHDPAQFLDAVKRDDALAVELYVLGRGVNLAARDAEGRSALDIAKRAGNAQIAELLARNLPAAR